MIELIIGTYGLGCWLVFKKFRLIPITTYTVCTAILGGIVLLMGILIMVSMYHPVAHDGRFYAAVTQITPHVRGTVIEVPVVPNEPVKQNDVLFRIDPTPYQLEVERLEAALAGMNTQAAQLEAFERARTAFYAGLYELALQEIDLATGEMPQDAAVHEFRGLIFFALGRYQKADGQVLILQDTPARGRSSPNKSPPSK